MKKIRKALAFMTALCIVLSLAACGQPSSENSKAPDPTKGPDPTQQQSEAPSNTAAGEITLWTYPVGNWKDEATVKALTDAFTAETGIKVKVDYLDYTAGDDRVNTALTANNAPDLILEGPERLVANWGANGHMVDLKDMFDDTDMSEINAVNEGIMKACTAPDGAIYEYPLVMTAHCMAVNLNAFKDAGADQYLDLDTHTWTTDDFLLAVDALYKHYNSTVAAVFCLGQGGDQGTRALVNNMYGGTYTNAEHTKYTWNDENNIKALTQLKSMNGIAFDASLDGGKEIAAFYQGTLKMAFCWNIAQQLDPNSAKTGAEKTLSGDDIAFMSFPSQDGTAQLCGGIWGFGIFDNGDDARIEAAKQFIKFMCDSEHTADAVKAANYFAVRTTAEGADLSKIWADDAIMNEYTKLMPFLGDYYQVTTGWAANRTEWWNMLQEVGTGADITEVINAHCDAANAAAG